MDKNTNPPAGQCYVGHVAIEFLSSTIICEMTRLFKIKVNQDLTKLLVHTILTDLMNKALFRFIIHGQLC